MQTSFDEVQKAFIEGKITLDELISLMKDIFGVHQTMRIIEHNLAIVMKEKAIKD